jgi:inosose dehydratase
MRWLWLQRWPQQAARSQLPRARGRRIGHTGITWGYSADNAPDAIRDAGELGFHGFESFGGVLETWQARGGLGDLLKAQQLPLIGAYCPLVLTNPAQRQQEVQKAVRWGRLIRDYGGRIAVIGPENVDRQRFDFAAQRAGIIATLNDIGLALADIGITAALHQHTGSCITTRDETWAVMENVARQVKLCPDTGELLAAGIDPLAAIRHFGEIIAHVHFKDYDGGARHDGYVPVGLGKVDVAAIMNALEALPGEFMVMAELKPGDEIEAHFHHGIETGYVLEGGTTQAPGQAPVELATGASIMNLRDVPHGGIKVVGTRTIKLVTVHIVDKGTPLYDPVKKQAADRPAAARLPAHRKVQRVIR